MVGFVMDATDRKFDITVLMGGISSEREVSLDSGRAIADALQQAGHNVTRADISPTDTSALDRKGLELVFIALHGEFGESGQVQQLCEDRGLKYTGSGVRASEIGMDKAVCKQILQKNGLSTAEWCIIEEFDSQDKVQDKIKNLTWPLIVKPIDGGSSVDVYLCKNVNQFNEALGNINDTYGRAMVENFIDGREFSVSLIEGAALPVMEICSNSEFFDYQAKYVDDSTTFTFDHDLPEELCDRMHREALAMFELIGCRDFARVDFMVSKDNIPYILEINTIPGFTTHSQLPSAAKYVGIDMVTLVDTIAKDAMAREGCCCK